MYSENGTIIAKVLFDSNQHSSGLTQSPDAFRIYPGTHWHPTRHIAIHIRFLS